MVCAKMESADATRRGPAPIAANDRARMIALAMAIVAMASACVKWATEGRTVQLSHA